MKLDKILEVLEVDIFKGENEIREYLNVCIDSRIAKEGDMFFAIKTEKNDGHKYISQAIENGIKLCIFTDEEYVKEDYKGVIFIKVNDVIKALHDIAKYNRNLNNIPMICVTGSVGKTTTREFIKKVLESKYNVLSTDKNYNNLLGVPSTLVKLNNHDIAVLELGMDSFGEIELLSKICSPDIAVITNIGTSHIEKLGSKENIKKAKLEILDGLKEGGILYLNKDDEFLIKDVSYNNIKYYGLTDYEIIVSNINSNLNSSEFDITYLNNKYTVKINVPGKHNILNSLIAIKIGLRFGIKMEDIIQSLSLYTLPQRRLEEIKKDNLTLIDDSYNASPESMKSAIDVLELYEGTKIAVLGDILELGKYSEEIHKDIGKYLEYKNIDTIISVGNNSKYYNAHVHFNNNQDVKKYLSNITDKCTILFKASNGMHLEEIINYLKNK